MRDIDSVIEFINASDRFSPVEKQVLVNRITPRPTGDELDAARRQLIATGQEVLGVG